MLKGASCHLPTVAASASFQPPKLQCCFWWLSLLQQGGCGLNLSVVLHPPPEMVFFPFDVMKAYCCSKILDNTVLFMFQPITVKMKAQKSWQSHTCRKGVNPPTLLLLLSLILTTYCRHMMAFVIRMTCGFDWCQFGFVFMISVFKLHTVGKPCHVHISASSAWIKFLNWSFV